MEFLIPSKSDNSFVLQKFTFLFEMYLTMKLSKSLMLLVFKAICLINLWRDIRWKLLLQSSGSVGELGSYGSWMLIMLSSSSLGATSCCCHSPWFTLPACSRLIRVALLFLFCGCYGTLNTNNFLFYFIFSDFTFLFLYFIFLKRRWRRHVTRKSHDMSHGVMSQA